MKSAQHGLSMVELMVTISIVSILMAIGVPSYRYVTTSNRVSAEVNGLFLENLATLYFADEAGGERAAEAFKPGPALILTGPEGGFTDDERALIRAAANVVPVSLGPRILRAETAALAALAAWMSAVGDWR